MKFDYSFESGFIIGYVAFAVSVITIFMSYFVSWMDVKKKYRLMTTLLMAKNNKKEKETHQMIELPPVQLLQKENKKIFMLEKFFARLSYTDLSNATDNFSQDNVIGLGTMGTMYKATLPAGLVLAVQRLRMSQLSMEHFVSELTMGRLRHRNLVPLLAFCEERKKRLLVYKYMSNGNLYDWLQHSKVGATTMEWPARAKIAIGLARGLAWLHHNCNFRVIHLDISSKCILLDENFEPKMSNLGRAMFMNPNDTDLSKTFFANNVLQESNLVKKDVLKFGVVLLELITGEDPTKNKFSFYRRLWTLAERVKHLSSSNAILNDAVDKSLIGQGFDAEIFHFLRIACNCVEVVPDQRPTMLEAYKMLKAVGERNGLNNDYEIMMQNEIAATDSGEECIELN